MFQGYACPSSHPLKFQFSFNVKISLNRPRSRSLHATLQQPGLISDIDRVFFLITENN